MDYELSAPQLQAQIERRPVDEWRDHLANIEDADKRQIVRNHLTTCFKLYKQKAVQSQAIGYGKTYS